MHKLSLIFILLVLLPTALAEIPYIKLGNDDLNFRTINYITMNASNFCLPLSVSENASEFTCVEDFYSFFFVSFNNDYIWNYIEDAFQSIDISSQVNASGLILNWGEIISENISSQVNASGLIQDWNSSGFIIDWNSTGIMLNYSAIISSSGNVSWNESHANTLYLNRSSEAEYTTTYNSSYITNTYNSTYANYNASGLIKNWNISGVIIDYSTIFNTSAQLNAFFLNKTNEKAYTITYNATYAGWNSSGFIKDWNITGVLINHSANINSSGLIINHTLAANETGYIIDWNNTGYIKNWNISGVLINYTTIFEISFSQAFQDVTPETQGYIREYANSTGLLQNSIRNNTDALLAKVNITTNLTFGDAGYIYYANGQLVIGVS